MCVGRGCFSAEHPWLSADVLRQAWARYARGRGAFWGAVPVQPTSLPSPAPATWSRHTEGVSCGWGPPGTAQTWGADSSLCPPFTISLSRAPRADPQVPTCTCGSSATHSWMAVQEPHPHPQEQGRSLKSHDQNLAWWGLGEMVAWRVLLALSSKFFWVVPGGFHSKWRIMSSLEVLAAIPRQQKESCLTSCPQAHSSSLSLSQHRSLNQHLTLLRAGAGHSG